MIQGMIELVGGPLDGEVRRCNEGITKLLIMEDDQQCGTVAPFQDGDTVSIPVRRMLAYKRALQFRDGGMTTVFLFAGVEEHLMTDLMS